jgi:hypothetical protein
MARTATNPILRLIRRVRRDPRAEGFADAELLRRFVGDRDNVAFETILRRHGAMVLDVCRGMLGNESDVEDAFQATFLVLARRAESIRRAARWRPGCTASPTARRCGRGMTPPGDGGMKRGRPGRAPPRTPMS